MGVHITERVLLVYLALAMLDRCIPVAPPIVSPPKTIGGTYNAKTMRLAPGVVQATGIPDAFEQDHPLTPEQFSSEEEFRFWKMWSDENYHGWELADHMLLTRPLYRKLLFPILRRRRSPTRRTESHRHSSILFEAKVDRPKAAPFVGGFYDSAEVQKLFEAAKGSKLEIPIFLGAFYGLRRSEAIGLKWDAIDFQNDTITIRHTVVSCYIDGKQVQKAQDITKTKSSMRTLPLIPAFKELLQYKKQQQNEFQRMCGKSYNKDYPGYICVDEMGRLLSPHYLTEAFAKLLKKHGLRKIRYHDLRHPYVKHTTKKYFLQKQKSQTTNKW